VVGALLEIVKLPPKPVCETVIVAVCPVCVKAIGLGSVLTAIPLPTGEFVGAGVAVAVAVDVGVGVGVAEAGALGALDGGGVFGG
jgi:hypothetical protein